MWFCLARQLVQHEPQQMAAGQLRLFNDVVSDRVLCECGHWLVGFNMLLAEV